MGGVRDVGHLFTLPRGRCCKILLTNQVCTLLVQVHVVYCDLPLRVQIVLDEQRNASDFQAQRIF